MAGPVVWSFHMSWQASKCWSKVVSICDWIPLYFSPGSRSLYWPQFMPCEPTAILLTLPRNRNGNKCILYANLVLGDDINSAFRSYFNIFNLVGYHSIMRPVCYQEVRERPVCYQEVRERPVCYQEVRERPGCYQEIRERPVCYQEIRERPGCYQEIRERPVCYQAMYWSKVSALIYRTRHYCMASQTIWPYTVVAPCPLHPP